MNLFQKKLDKKTKNVEKLVVGLFIILQLNIIYGNSLLIFIPNFTT